MLKSFKFDIYNRMKIRFNTKSFEEVRILKIKCNFNMDLVSFFFAECRARQHMVTNYIPNYSELVVITYI